MKLTINADDFGMDENRTRAICEAFDRHLISTTTAMANMPWFERAMQLAKERCFIKRVGLHFCISEGRPLTSEMRSCRMFCDDQGCFTGSFHLNMKTRLFLPQYARKAVAAEAKAQIERYLDCGGEMMHLDSHHHVHTDFSVATVLLPLAKRYGFRSCRMARTISSKPNGLLKTVYKKLFNIYANHILPFTVDEFTDLDDYRHFMGEIPKDKSVEIMVHPLYRNSSGSLDLNGEFMDSKRPLSDMEADLVQYTEIR